MTAPVAPAPPRGPGVRGGQIALVVVGVLVALIGLVGVAGGSALVWAHTTQRDAAGFYTSPADRYGTVTYALTSRVDLGTAPGERGWTITHPVGTVRIRATGPADRPLFVGIARQDDVDAWLAGVSQERVVRPNFGPLTLDTTVIAGDRAPEPPLRQTFWAASGAGTGTQTVMWPSQGGQWAIVVMNVDASPGVAAVVDVGAKTALLLPLGLGIGALGLLLLGAAATMLFFGLRHQATPTATTEEAAARVPPGTYPARLDGHLDPGLSRWLWLVKWLLLIPHFVVLAFLWLTVGILTVFAWFAILFTGRYPKAVFDFNVGVMRWTWRVAFYSLGAFGTDRYPPFSLRDEPSYPATFQVDYPERLSRGLVLVKSWLLAVPHLLIVGIFAGGWGFGFGGWRVAAGVGLIGLLACIAVIMLAFGGRYPESIFDLVMGLNRWCYRVLAYVALMRDEYPPFRLDSGGLDPGSVPTGPPPPGTPSTSPEAGIDLGSRPTSGRL